MGEVATLISPASVISISWRGFPGKLNAEKAHIALPMKPEPPKGKRSSAGWRQKAVLLREESILRATERLKRRNDRTDFSDLMQALLEAWLDTPE
jgi:hypothetical protein